MRGIQTKMAAGLALVALGSLAGYAVGAGPAGDQGAAATAAKRQPVEVRTRTIHRTIRIVRHEKPRRPRPQPPAPTASPPAAELAAVSQTAPAPPAAPPAAKLPATTSPPVRTRTSGGGSRSGGERELGGEREGEGEDD